MKYVRFAFALLILSICICGCGGTQEPEETQVPELLLDIGFQECASEAFSEIGIEPAMDSYIIIEDNSNEITRDVTVTTEINDITMRFQCFYDYYSKSWYAVNILDAEKDIYYWTAQDVKEYADIYDWKTGKLVSAKTKELP